MFVVLECRHVVWYPDVDRLDWGNQLRLLLCAADFLIYWLNGDFPPKQCMRYVFYYLFPTLSICLAAQNALNALTVIRDEKFFSYIFVCYQVFLKGVCVFFFKSDVDCWVLETQSAYKLNYASWIKIDQLMSLALFFARHVSNASTFIFRSLRLCVGILLCKDRVI